MELVNRTNKAPKLAHEDFISNMPDNVITNILNRLPLQDAVRTGILLRNWRFKWNMLSQLVIDENFFKFLSKGNTNSYGSVISTMLLHLNGFITKCVLHNNKLTDEYICNCILFLSRKGIKDLTLVQYLGARPLNLPIHLFSCLKLERLKLHICCFKPPPSFYGFPNLLSLELTFGGEKSELGKFISMCPLLENLKVNNTGKVKLVEIANLKNLKILSLSLRERDITTISSNNIFELLGSLPKLQELFLKLDFKLIEDGARKKFSTSFLSLKTLRLFRIDLGNRINLSFAFELIWSSPNLQTLDIHVIRCVSNPLPIPEVEYNKTALQRVVFAGCFAGSENEMCLIKYLLACSPFLKNILIRPSGALAPCEQLMITMKLLKLPRASTVAQIDFEGIL